MSLEWPFKCQFLFSKNWTKHGNHMWKISESPIKGTRAPFSISSSFFLLSFKLFNKNKNHSGHSIWIIMDIIQAVSLSPCCWSELQDVKSGEANKVLMEWPHQQRSSKIRVHMFKDYLILLVSTLTKKFKFNSQIHFSDSLPIYPSLLPLAIA